MRIHTLLNAAAITLAATLIGCGPQGTLVTKIFVCADKSQTEDPRSCPPGPFTEKFVCEGNKNLVVVDTAEECPIWTLSCPEGTTPYANHESNDRGCSYDATCHEGWAYEPSTQTCKKFCGLGEKLSSDGINCIPAEGPAHTIVLSQHGAYAGGSSPHSIAWLQAWGDTDEEITRLTFRVVASRDEGQTWSSNYANTPVLIGAGGCRPYENNPFGIYDVGVIRPDGTGDTLFTVDLSYGIPVHVGDGVKQFGVDCDLSPAAYNIRVALELVSARAERSDTEVFIGLSNKDHAQYITYTDPPDCGTPTITRHSGSPNGPMSPSFGEVLRFNVTAPSCGDFVFDGIAFRVVTTDNANSGWNTSRHLNAVNWDLRNTAEPSTEIFAGHWTYNASGEVTAESDVVSRVDLFPEAQTIAAETTKTYSLKVDTSGVSASQDDVMRVDIIAFCYRQVGHQRGVCAGNFSPTAGITLVTGGTLIY